MGRTDDADAEGAPVTTPDEDWEAAEPRPEALIESLRAFGYSTEAAVADLIDNSVSAGARNIDITFHWDGEDSLVAITDDGTGMTEPGLSAAMRPGSRSPLEERAPGDLGRFGLGLKTAAFSQCRELTVVSCTRRTPPAVRRWDLDYVGEVGAWRLRKSSAPLAADIVDQFAPTRGTLVVWTKLDRLVGGTVYSDAGASRRFLKLVARVQAHLEMTFHRFMRGRKKVTISINGHELTPWDPFLGAHAATQQLPSERFRLRGHEVEVQPYVLPHRSKLSAAEQDRGFGVRGWNAHQGFYVYRADRLLVAGEWLGLGFGKDEHCKLARIAINLPVELDHDWQIDVKKATARPPGPLAEGLRRVAAATRQIAQEVYRHRGKVAARNTSQPFVFAWQEVKTRDGDVKYAVNRQHPVVERALDLPKPLRAKVEQLIRFMEETVPVPLIGLRLAEAVESQSKPFENRASKEIRTLFTSTVEAMEAKGERRADAVRRLSVTEPFNNYPELVATALEDGDAA